MPVDNTADNSRTTYFRIFFLTLVGIALSVYLSIHHIEVNSNSDAGPSFCAISASFDCDSVARSAYSELAGIPLANLGLAFYIWLGWLSFSSFRGRENNIDSAIVLLSSLGLIFSLFYLGISWFVLGTICIFCSMLYVCGIAIFFLSLKLRGDGGLLKSLLAGLVAGLSWFFSIGAKDLILDLVFLACAVFSLFKLPEALHGLFYSQKAQLQPVVSADDSSYRDWLAAPTKKFVLNSSGSIVERDFIRGASNAKVTLVEFSDLECPHCRRAAPTFKALLNKYPESLRVVSRNFPLDSTCNNGVPKSVVKSSCRGARATRCAGEISDTMYWKIHDELFKYPNWDSSLLDDLDNYFEEGNDRTKFKVCMESDYPVGVQRDIREADRVGLQSTPTIFLNGKLVGTSKKEVLEGIIDRILASSKG